jgi:uncharacterized protein
MIHFFMKNKNKTLIWQYNIEGGLSKNYLIGTMHAKDGRIFKNVENYYRIIHDCDIFATEFPLDDAEAVNIQQYMMLPEGESLQKLLSAKFYDKMGIFMKQKLGVDMAQFNHFSPFFLTNLLTESVLNNDNFLSLDESLWQFAKNDGKILRGIETFDEQLEILKKMTLTDQIKGLKDIVGHHARFRKQLEKMIKCYEKQDILKLFHLAKKSTKSSRKLMLYDRNKIMTGRIIDLCKENTLCAAIGAGHLAGKKGVLNLLKMNGFEVKPIQ